MNTTATPMTFALCAALAATAALAQSPTHDLDLPDQLPTGIFAAADGAFEADGRSYRARFDDTGATLRVPDPADRDREVALALRLVDWGRPGFGRATAPRSPARAGADRVDYRHDGITERYARTDEGIEQSFVIHRRPAGAGDLVLGIAAASDALAAPPCAAAHQAIELRGGDAVIRYGEAVAFERGGERVPIATRYDGVGRIELVVPAALLDGANYPLIVDPAIGAPLTPGGFSYPDTNPDVAYDPVSGNVCIVWQREFSTNDVRIRGAIFTRTGGTVQGLLNVTAAGFTSWPTVAYVDFNGQRRFLVAWSTSTGIRARHYASDTGFAQGVEQALSTVSPGTRDRRPALSVSSSGLALFWDRTPSGSAEPNQILVRRLGLPPSGSTTISLLPEHVIETVTTGWVRRPRTPRTHLFQFTPLLRVCWERFYPSPAPGDTDLRMTYFSINTNIGYLQGPASVPGAATIGVDEQRPDIAMIDEGASQRDYLLAWDEQGDVKGLRYDNAGPVGGEFAIAAGGNFETGPAVGAGRTEFSVAYLRAPSSSPTTTQTIYGARVLTDGSVTVTDSLIDSTIGWTNADLRASSVPDSSSPNQPNGVFFAWTLETTPGGLQYDIRARRYDPIGAEHAPIGVGCPGPGGLVPSISTNGNAYPGNSEFAISVQNAPPNTIAALMASHTYGFAAVPGAPGCNLYLGLPLAGALLTLTDAAGGGTIDLPLPNTVPSGAALAFQWALYTPGHNPLGWIVSDDIDITWYQ